jgi:cytochrome c biogenesis protein CcmG, thiol:disulfide interchange protein DsbE
MNRTGPGTTSGRRRPAKGNAKGRGGRPSWQPRQRRLGPVLWAAAVLVGLLAIAAVVITRDDGAGQGEAAARSETAAVQVTGTALPPLPSGGGTDPAVGRQAPALRGTGFDGGARAISADGRPKVVIFLAHWCPHCQREVPQIVDWLAAGSPDGVDLYSVATATSQQQPNYPPSAWLAREGWTLPVLTDDAGGTAAAAYGVSGFPFFVFVDADGKVVKRTAGELPTDQLQAEVTRLATSAAR